jgi:hypothetical protein
MVRDGTALDGSIAEKIAWAEATRRELDEFLRRDSEIDNLLQRLRVAIRRSTAAMLEAGVVWACARCEREEGGSCCGEGLENRYDGVMLLINLLLGARLPEQRRDPASCFFLGGDGCLLMARDVICVNYLCQRITGRLDGQKLTAMRDQEGEQLEILFRLHARLASLARETGHE